ncbi:MAG: TonB-dependent receptor, partial [Acidobacteriota bacterium]|nr:TonB-dependent receptor [Acidobacteriota bacterium]
MNNPRTEMSINLTFAFRATAAAVLAFCFLAHEPIASAQSASATLSGIVVDQNGAVVAGATIMLVNPATGFTRESTTDNAGEYTFTSLVPGTYTVTVRRDGFAPVDVRDVVLNVNDQRSLRIQLKVGQLGGETVNVNAGDASLVNESPSVGTVVDRRFVSNLPLNGRSFQSLISLAPGVAFTRAQGANAGQFSVNGQRSNSNYFTVDGVSANVSVNTTDVIGQQAAGSLPGLTTFGGTNTLASVEAVQEFRVQTSTFAPEFGRSPGAQVSVVTRSGTNGLHGSLYEFFRNDALDANDWFSNRDGLPKAAERQNDFGVALGGPVVLPRFGEGGRRLWSGRDRTFFFFSYEGLRLRQPFTLVTAVPSLRVRELTAPGARPLVDAFPLPTGPESGTSGLAPFVGNYSSPSNLNATSVRIDQNLPRHWTLFGRYNDAPSDTGTRPKSDPAEFDLTRFSTRTLTLGTTALLSKSVINDLRFNYSRTSGTLDQSLTPFGGARPFDLSILGAPAGFTRPSLFVQVGSRPTFFLGRINANLQRQLNVTDSLSVTRSAHDLKFGADYRRLTPVYGPREYTQTYFFFTESSLRENSSTFSLALGIKSTRPVYNNTSAFAQDTWRARPRLTLTYGLRWEVNPPPHDALGQQPFVVRGLDDPATATLAPPGTPLWRTTYNNFAPRFGAAYQLSRRPGRETTLRGGFGLFYDLGNGPGANAFTNAPFVTGFNLLFGLPFPLPAESSGLPPFAADASHNSIAAFAPDLKLPYTWQWNLTAERSLGRDQTFTAAYVGAVGRRLLRDRAIVRPNPNFSFVEFVDNGATSDYHAMQLQFDRRLSRGLRALASYTWSHAIDEVSDEVSATNATRGDADFDVRHNFAGALSYDLPATFAGRAARALLGGWSVDAIVHAQSAYPFTVFVRTGAVVGLQEGDVRPDLLGGVPLYLSDRDEPGGRRVNPAAFQAPPADRPGTLGRNSLRGFPLTQLDLKLRRQFALTERLTLQLSGEMFNALNHPNFAPPVNTLDDPVLFGRSTQMLGASLGGLSPVYQIGGPRSAQLAA